MAPRLRAMCFRRSFSGRLLALRDDLGALTLACSRVRQSRRLKSILKGALKLGNSLNNGSGIGGGRGGGSNADAATAVSIESLVKLSSVKSKSSGVNAMEYLVMMLQPSSASSSSSSLLDFAEDFRDVAATAARVDFSQLQNEMKSIETELSLCARVSRSGNHEGEDKTKGFAAFLFASRDSTARAATELSDSRDSFSSLLDFFLADPSSSPSDFFGALLAFATAFAKARAAVEWRERQKATEERRQEAAAQRQAKKAAALRSKRQQQQEEGRYDDEENVSTSGGGSGDRSSEEPKPIGRTELRTSNSNYCSEDTNGETGAKRILVPSNIRALVAAQVKHRARLLSRGDL